MARSTKNQETESAASRLAPKSDTEAFELAMLERWPPLSVSGVGLRLATTALVFYSTWRAIHDSGATALALLLPMVAEILAAIVCGFVLAVFIVREHGFTRQVWGGIRTWVIIAFGFLAWQYYQGSVTHNGFGAQLHQAWLATRGFVLESGFLQAMLMAAIGFCAGVVNDVAAYRRNGPPFIYLSSLNFGLRTFLMLILGWILLLMIFFARDFTRRQSAEAMWFALLLAEFFALWLPHVVQNKIRAARASR